MLEDSSIFFIPSLEESIRRRQAVGVGLTCKLLLPRAEECTE